MEGKTISIVLLSDYLKSSTHIVVDEQNVTIVASVINTRDMDSNIFQETFKDIDTFAVFNESKAMVVNFALHVVNESIQKFTTDFLGEGCRNMMACTYNYTNPKENMTPPLLPPRMKVSCVQDLQSYLLQFSQSGATLVGVPLANVKSVAYEYRGQDNSYKVILSENDCVEGITSNLYTAKES